MPDTVRIGPLTYRVSEDANEHLLSEEGMGIRLYGSGDKSQQIIQLRPGLAPGFSRQILLHEIIHQLFDDSGLELEAQAEEQICLSLQAPLLGVLKDNPELVRWLVAEG